MEQKKEDLMYWDSITLTMRKDETYMEFVDDWFRQYGKGAFVVVPDSMGETK